MKRLLLTLALVLGTSPAVNAADVNTPMQFERKFSGEQNLRFSRGGQKLNPANTRMTYRVIRTKKDWKRVWGYLYDSSLDVDFSKHRVLAIYKSPANGGFTITPTRVGKFEDRLKVDVDITWNGKTQRTHPFLFLVVDKFWGLDVNEKFIAPSGKDVRYP